MLPLLRRMSLSPPSLVYSMMAWASLLSTRAPSALRLGSVSMSTSAQHQGYCYETGVTATTPGDV
jgi:hypothetical protein